MIKSLPVVLICALPLFAQETAPISTVSYYKVTVKMETLEQFEEDAISVMADQVRFNTKFILAGFESVWYQDPHGTIWVTAPAAGLTGFALEMVDIEEIQQLPLFIPMIEVPPAGEDLYVGLKVLEAHELALANKLNVVVSQIDDHKPKKAVVIVELSENTETIEFVIRGGIIVGTKKYSKIY